MSTKSRTSHMRCAPGYRHNGIIVLIVGEPNRYDVSYLSHRIKALLIISCGIALLFIACRDSDCATAYCILRVINYRGVMQTHECTKT